MPQRYRQDELIDLVEGELAPRQESRLRERLERDADARRMVEGMAADRAALRDLPVPELTTDLLAGMEERLARPMLMEYQPGSYRRSRETRRSRRLLVGGSLAAAATVALALTAWQVWPTPAAPESRGGALALESAAPAPVVIPQSPDESAWPPIGALVHHEAPLPFETESSIGTVLAAAPTEPVLAPFALAFASELGGESLRVAGATAGAIGIVRNMTDLEARAIINSVARSGTEGRSLPPALAGIDVDEPGWRGRVGDAFSRLDQAGDPSVSDAVASGTIAGDAALAPTIQTQLQLSATGAGFTIAVARDDLAALLAKLAGATDEPAGLVMMPKLSVLNEATLAAPTLDQWSADYRAVREFVDALEPGSIVWLPVAVPESD